MAQRAGSNKLLREFAQIPITGIALYGGEDDVLYVLAGEDGHLKVYAAETGRLVCDIPVFADQPVHGIHVQQHGSQGRVIVWGASLLAIFTIDAQALESGVVPVLAKATAPDWIYDAAVSPFDPSRAVIITAHNETLVLAVGLDGSVTLGSLVSPSRPMLYSAHLTWISEGCVLVGGGTVFGDVLVWKYYIGAGDAPGHFEMLSVLSGHEGSIFGVDISPMLTLEDGSLIRLLSSCSDDRTIRIWDITEREKGDPLSEPSAATHLNTTPETGFRTTPSYDDMIPSLDVVPITVVMGHLSRIWSAKFVLSSPTGALRDNKLAVYSFGEDSTAQRWQLELGSAKEGGVTGKMAHSQTFSLHNGKHLWAGAAMTRAGKALVASGGADARISLIEEATATSGAADTQSGIPSGLIMLYEKDMPANSTAPPPSKKGQEMISRYDFLQEGELLVTTTHGRLLRHSQDASGQRWRELAVQDDMKADLKLCYVVRNVGHGVALLGTTSGNVYFANISGDLIQAASLPGKVVDITYLSQRATQNSSSEPLIEVVVHLFGTVNSHHLAIDRSTGLLESQEEIAGLDPRFVAVSAAKARDLLLIGSRHGYLSIYRRSEGRLQLITNAPAQSKDAITAIVPLPSKPTDGPLRPLYILTTSRDGKYRIFEVTSSADSVHLHLLHETSLPFGPMIEDAWFTSEPTPQLILCGFRSKNFVMWNETTREEQAAVECGGAHRIFRMWQDAGNPGRFQFAFTKVSRLSIFSQGSVAHKRVKLGGHGREIRALSSNGRYLATGSEDTSIRIWEYEPGQGQTQAEMRCLASMKAHVSGIQRIQWLGHDYLFSSGGNEEFYVWRVRELDAGYRGPAVVCEAVFADKSAIGDLRILDFDVYQAGTEQPIIVTLAFSNSTLKTYRYTLDDGFVLFAEGFYTGACLTQVRHLDVRGSHLSVLTASTDGHLALWSTDMVIAGSTRRYALQHVTRLHQSSIKSMDMIRAGDGHYRILTGGDDNALGVATLNESVGKADNVNTVYSFSESAVCRGAHAAAINGVALIRTSMGNIVGASVSNDQRVKTWGMERLKEGRVELLENAYSGVADAGDVTVIGQGLSRSLVVGGVGLEVWALPK